MGEFPIAPVATLPPPLPGPPCTIENQASALRGEVPPQKQGIPPPPFPGTSCQLHCGERFEELSLFFFSLGRSFRLPLSPHCHRHCRDPLVRSRTKLALCEEKFHPRNKGSRHRRSPEPVVSYIVGSVMKNCTFFLGKKFPIAH